MRRGSKIPYETTPLADVHEGSPKEGQDMMSRPRRGVESPFGGDSFGCWRGISLITLLAINLVWLPGTIYHIHENNVELQRVEAPFGMAVHPITHHGSGLAPV
jgi:hypothetical protein